MCQKTAKKLCLNLFSAILAVCLLSCILMALSSVITITIVIIIIFIIPYVIQRCHKTRREIILSLPITQFCYVSIPSIAQLVERRTVEVELSSLGRWFESGSKEYFFLYLNAPQNCLISSVLNALGQE